MGVLREFATKQCEQRRHQIVGPDHADLRAELGRAPGVPAWGHDQGAGAVGIQQGGRRADRLEAGKHRHRIGLLDEMRAVMQGDEKQKLLVLHAPANVREALLEVH
jgi:uncharacterized protein with von Willebrand factor type A (vWA) domain